MQPLQQPARLRVEREKLEELGVSVRGAPGLFEEPIERGAIPAARITQPLRLFGDLADAIEVGSVGIHQRSVAR